MTSEPARPADPGNGADPAASATVVARQRAEMERLRDVAALSAVLERAKGALMATTGCSPAAAHDELLRRAEADNRTLLEECWLTLGALVPPQQDAPGAAAAGAARPTAAATWEAAPAGTDDLAEVLGHIGRDLVRVGSPQELAGCLLEHLTPEAGADAVLLYERLPEGGLELVGHAGVDGTLAAQWHRVPPLSGVAPIDALRVGEPRWLEDTAADRQLHLLIGDPPERWLSRAWLPVPAGDGAGFALGVLRRRDGPFAPRERELLRGVVRLCAGRLRAFDTPPERPEGGAAQAVQSVFDALPGAAILLTPLRAPSGEVADYRIDAATPDAVDVLGRAGRDMVGRHILESCPSVAGEPLWHGYLDALITGVPFESEPFAYEDVADGVPVTATYSVRAAPLGDGLLVTWLRHAPVDRQEQRLADVQRLGNLGWANWNLLTGEIAWSAQAYTVLGLDPAGGPVRLERLADLVLPEDAGALAHSIAELVLRARPFDVPFRIDAPEGVRHLRIVAEAVADPDGTPAEVHGFVQDLTAQRSAELALVESERAMLLQRGILQAERALAARLQHALLPLPSKPVRLAGLRIEVAYLPAQSGIHVGGDWFSAIELPDDAALFAVGDVVGHGIGAVATMAQLRFAAKGMVSTGSSLTGALARLNRLLLHSRDDRTTATMVLARYDPGTHVLAWAQAGHPPPLLVRRGEVRYLDRPGGMLLGASANPVFESAELRLEPGDRLVLYTDGLVERPGEDIDAAFARLADAVRADGRGGAGSLEALLATMLADERRDDVCVLDIRMPAQEE
ncbi:protein phosphatase [Streptomyces cellostaticus]|uniref:Protein phosphatase n=1 Tax=Streptomyces cellostaticus TaxID=67285 RepID=A0A101NQF3_9ACTN|nr:SpoIIE family protein phosphatase [Streptomyces cellostaticus]KUM97142.1 protein phosphatase [Streptomyces cellostaticus]GHI03779.1 transcription antitermination regulator [Streptomyces cellostaticus]